jgi:hypothetical protein
LTLQTYKNERGRLDGDGAAMPGSTEHAALSAIVLGLGGGGVRIRWGRHSGTDRCHIERIGCGIRDHAKCRDRRNQLHQYREQHDWNKYFQPPSHDFPQDAPWVSLSPASPLVEIACGAASVHAHVRILSFRRIQRNKLALPEFWRLTMTDYGALPLV